MTRIFLYVVALLGFSGCHGFVSREAPRIPLLSGDQLVTKTDASLGFRTLPKAPRDLKLYDSVDNNDSEKFGFFQRIESIKCLAIGGISGSIGFALVGFIQDIIIEHSTLAQWEFDTDMAALQGGLFAIVYRYCIRQDTNPQLNQGVLGAFVLTRTLSSINVPTYCSAIPLNCGAPLGYVDWNIIGQCVANGATSAAIFGVTAVAVDKAMDKGFLSRFPG